MKNQKWYNQKAVELNSYVAFFQRTNPRPFVFSEVSDNKNRIFKIMDAYGVLFTSEEQLKICHSIQYSEENNLEEALDKMKKEIDEKLLRNEINHVLQKPQQ